MALINALLIRSGTGWTERTDPASITANTRFEAYLALGAIQTEDGVDTYADAQLDIFANPREEIITGIAPIGIGDTPYLSYQVGDVVTVPNSAGTGTSERVRSITVTEDKDTGVAVYSPQFKDFILERAEQIQIAIKKMSNGSLAGASQVAQPIRENFVPREVDGVLFGGSGVVGFDAIVDPDLPAANPSAFQWKTVGDALRGLKTFFGGVFATNRSVVIGVRGRGATSIATETAVIADADCPEWIHLIGLGGSATRRSGGIGAAAVHWSAGGFTIGGVNWFVENLRLSPGGSTKATFFTSAAPTVRLNNCQCNFFATVSCAVTGTVSIPAGVIIAEHTYFIDAYFASDETHLFDCHISYTSATSTSWGSNTTNAPFDMFGGTIEARPGNPITVSLIYRIVNIIGVQFGGIWPGSAVGVLTFSLDGGTSQRVHMITSSASPSDAGEAGPGITNTTTPDHVNLVGSFGPVTIPAPSGNISTRPHVISGDVFGTCSITGPAKVDISCTSTVTLAGDHIVGDVIAAASGAQTALTISANDSAIDATVRQSGGATSQAYNVTGTRDFLDITGTTAAGFTVASANGAGNTVRAL